MNAVLRLTDGQCQQRWLVGPYRETLKLRGGRQVTLRPVRHRDAPALQAFFAALTPTARRLRFHGAVNRLPDAVLRALTTQVPHQHVALVAVAPLHDGAERLVAEARYVTQAHAPQRAEFALTVTDDWQGQGLGRALLQRLATHAAAEGLLALDGQVMADNQPMLALLRRLEARFHSQGSEVHAVLTL